MTAGSISYTRRQDAGEHLKTVIGELDQALARSGHRRLVEPAGELGGFPVLVTIERVMTSAQVIVELQGAPGTEIRMTPPEIAASEPGKIIVRLEGRLSGMEALKAKSLAEIERLTTEAEHARDDLHKPFAHTAELDQARARVQQIAAQMNRAAEPARPQSGRVTTVQPDWVRDALRNPDDPRWLAAAAARDAMAMAAIPGSAVAVASWPGSPESPAQAASLNFPAASPAAGAAPADSQAAGRSSQPSPRGPSPRA